MYDVEVCVRMMIERSDIDQPRERLHGGSSSGRIPAQVEAGRAWEDDEDFPIEACLGRRSASTTMGRPGQARRVRWEC